MDSDLYWQAIEEAFDAHVSGNVEHMEWMLQVADDMVAREEGKFPEFPF